MQSTAERRQMILQALCERRSELAENLAVEFGVTTRTIYNDIEILAYSYPTKHSKPMWQCVTSTKGGRRFCPDSKGIEEEQIEEAFVESYKRFCIDYSDVMDEFLQRVENSLAENTLFKEADKLRRESTLLEEKKRSF